MVIELCDYTLRSGIPEYTPVSERARIATCLAEAGIENIELGWLTDCKIQEYYPLVEVQRTSYSVTMSSRNFEYNMLPECTGKIQKIRIMLHRGDWNEPVKAAKELASKGYEPVCEIENAYEYTDAELIQLCEKMRTAGVRQVTITGCSAFPNIRTLQRITMLLDNNLDLNEKIGIRCEGNASLAHFTADNFIGIPVQKERTVIVEGTLFSKSCICTECMADLLNEDFDAHYDYEELIRLISRTMPESNIDPGDSGLYHPVFYLSAKNQVDGDYGRYFLSKGVLLCELDSFLKKVAETQRLCFFDEAVAEQIYREKAV